ncbi:protein STRICTOSIDINE SYNTHASE-LIKE 7-like [Mangifera indica]|uniref:protein STRICTOSIDINE SYNTHASE-LIKE 7-like n=1 Tax=Mangifera indica TaxID=29780 RepID=UPI001CF9965B|nr:protein STRICTOSIDINE SYNTHASE-LIKE 7-like [Mangifera indica]XP_044469609.1 protein STRICTOSIDINE SYNTHASE-LIKE 7-like [Mangifera indica]
MSNSAPHSAPPTQRQHQQQQRLWRSPLVFSVMVPLMAAVFLYQLDSFQPAHMPVDGLSYPGVKAPKRNDRILQGAELLGLGVLPGPEDIVYDSRLNVIYTGCEDGWIKRVTLNDSVVENWINTGGRPLGLALRDNEFVVADAYKGLLKINANEIELLTDEAESQKFKLTDAVEIAEDGMIYFTDASYKYDVSEVNWDFLEGKPFGRLLSFDPVTKNTKLLLHHLYFANGVTISPDQTFLVFCETFMRRCSKYYIKGKEAGHLEKFIENLPGIPDNIHYDGEGLYWIAFASEFTRQLDLMFRYPFIRKFAGILYKYMGLTRLMKNAGVMAVDLEGKPVAHYQDPGLPMISSGIKIGDNLYCGSLFNSYILRLDLNKHPAVETM